MSERVMGYSLLGFGIVVMLFALVQVFLVFTNHAKPLSIFNLSTSSVSSVSNSINIQDIIGQLEKGSSSGSNPSLSMPMPNLFPPELLNQTLNLTTHFFLMTFLMGFGFKLASLGVMLVRPIKVKLKSSVVEVDEANPPPKMSS